MKKCTRCNRCWEDRFIHCGECGEVLPTPASSVLKERNTPKWTVRIGLWCCAAYASGMLGPAQRADAAVFGAAVATLAMYLAVRYNVVP